MRMLPYLSGIVKKDGNANIQSKTSRVADMTDKMTEHPPAVVDH